MGGPEDLTPSEVRTHTEILHQTEIHPDRICSVLTRAKRDGEVESCLNECRVLVPQVENGESQVIL